MPRTIPWLVPKTYDVAGDEHGTIGSIQALQYAMEADRLAAMYEARYQKAPVDGKTEAHYEERRDYYLEQSIEWRACALSTLLKARRLKYLADVKRRRDERDAAELKAAVAAGETAS